MGSAQDLNLIMQNIVSGNAITIEQAMEQAKNKRSLVELSKKTAIIGAVISIVTLGAVTRSGSMITNEIDAIRPDQWRVQRERFLRHIRRRSWF